MKKFKGLFTIMQKFKGQIIIMQKIKSQNSNYEFLASFKMLFLHSHRIARISSILELQSFLRESIRSREVKTFVMANKTL